MRTPPYLQKGDKIALAAPARSIDRETLMLAMHVLIEEGFLVQLDDEVLGQENQFSGSDAQRAIHFQHLLDDPTVKAILCARGGYGSNRIIDKLNFTNFVRHPKWIVGYSDITMFHAHLQQQLKVESLHATMPVNFQTNTHEAMKSFFEALMGVPTDYRVPAHPLNRIGKASGMLAGGNLSILSSLAASADFPDTMGKILFLEDIDEYLYHIDRMIISLKRAGVFDGLSALIVGGMSEMKDNAVPFGKTAEEIILEHVNEYDFPVCFGFPAGHIPDNRALILGRLMTLELDESVVLLTDSSG
ncbi:MAG: LD-carboxypeptidase [Bacteroidales bacterium]|nr:LD-carboxypeptidase [Bacteroidales bacterium]